jgi:hypothetical protein
MNYHCATNPILPFITALQLLQNIALKGYLTRDEWLSLFQLKEKSFVRSVDPKQPKNIKCSLWSIIETFPRGGAWLFRGGAKRSQWRCATSYGTSPQNQAMSRTAGGIIKTWNVLNFVFCQNSTRFVSLVFDSCIESFSFVSVWFSLHVGKFAQCSISLAPAIYWPAETKQIYKALCVKISLLRRHLTWGIGWWEKVRNFFKIHSQVKTHREACGGGYGRHILVPRVFWQASMITNFFSPPDSSGEMPAEEATDQTRGTHIILAFLLSIIGSFFETEHNRQNFQKASIIGKSFGITSFCQRN